MSDSLYERARIGLYGVNLGAGRDDWVVLMHSALDAGEKAEKRARQLENDIQRLELQAIPSRNEQQAIIQEANAKYRQRAEATERERDALKARVAELEQTVADAKKCPHNSNETCREMADELSETRARIEELEAQAKPHD